MGKSLWDDPAYVIATLLPRYQGLDLGSPSKRFGSLYLSGDIDVEGDLTVAGSLIGQGGVTIPLGDKLLITAGTNGKAGTVTITGATPVSVATTAFTANSVVSFSLKTVGGTVGEVPSVKTVTPGTGFTVAGTALDTSVYNWFIIDIA